MRDIIAAVATPPGEGGVAVLRVSGAGSPDLAKSLFASSRPGFGGFRPWVMHHGRFLDRTGRALDEVLAVFMPGPRSFTGEDVVEFHCHGGRALAAAVLEEILACGARLARPGEFTLRAFLNGRLDLSQAEAVAEIIAAPTRAAAQLAQVKLSGVLGGRIRDLRESLRDLRARLCLAVDFPEEEVECLSREDLRAEVEAAAEGMRELLAGVDRARAWREGALAVLAGPVNAGKSSLLNALLGKNRALVADQPGTTRDYIEETVLLDGLAVRLADTAGLRSSADEVERAGMDLGRNLAAEADLVLFVADGARPADAQELEEAERVGPGRGLAVINKADLAPADPDPAVAFAALGFEMVKVSARTGHGLSDLAARIRARVLHGRPEPDPDAAAPNARQAACLQRALTDLAALAQDAAAGVPYDLLTVRLDSACDHLSEITGEIAPQEVLDHIFGRFCIGK